jgi:hypothetical protein
LRIKWIELHVHETSELFPSTEFPKRNFTSPSVPLPKAQVISEYNEVVQKDLFARDRSSNVTIAIERDPPAPPSPPMPPLPVYFGTMFIGDPVIVLEFPKGTQKNYHAGEKVGAVRLVSFDSEIVVFDWDGKKVERTVAQLRDGASDAAYSGAAASATTTMKTAALRSNLTSTSPEPSDRSTLTTKLGMDTGVGVRLCLTGETSPAGTVIDGYRKRKVNGAFGPTCSWELLNRD